MAVEIYMPKMSDHMLTGRVVRWYVKEGDMVQRGQVLLEIETDKAIGEIEAPESGVVRGMRADEGEDVSVGETIAFIAAVGEDIKPPVNPSAANTVPVEEVTLPAGEPSAASQVAGEEENQIFATPVARRMAKDYGLDIRIIQGTGPKGRIKREDVEAYLEVAKPAAEVSQVTTQAQPPAAMIQSVPPVMIPQPSNGDTIHLTNVQRITGQRMVESVTTAPHFFLEVKVDMTRALELIETVSQRTQASGGERISVTALLIRVAGASLKKHPRVNTVYENGNLRKGSQINIGVAVGTDQGLTVPVIREADTKTIVEINLELKGFQAKGKEMRFGPADLDGGTFTISNLGMYGVDVFQAIINPPQSAILAVGRIIKTPVAMEDDTVKVRPMMNLTLSVDHRVLDGIQGSQFLAEMKDLIENPCLLV